MTSVNITISKEAYDFLRRLKRSEQSFSDVILAVKRKKQDVLSYAGIFRDVDLSDIEKAREKMSKEWMER